MGCSNGLSLSMWVLVVVLFLMCYSPQTSAKVAGFGGPSRGVKRPLDESDMGMPISHPAVMIPLIGLIIMGMVFIMICCLKLFPKSSENPAKNVPPAPVVRLQLGRKDRSRSRTPQPEIANKYLQNKHHKHAHPEPIDSLPYDCYIPAKPSSKPTKIENNKGEKLV